MKPKSYLHLKSDNESTSDLPSYFIKLKLVNLKKKEFFNFF